MQTFYNSLQQYTTMMHLVKSREARRTAVALNDFCDDQIS